MCAIMHNIYPLATAIVVSMLAAAPEVFRDLATTSSQQGAEKSIELAQRLLPDPAGSRLAGNQFGSSIAIDGTRALIAAPLVDLPASDAGIAYLFEYKNEQWQHIATLQPEGLVEGDRFGADVDLDGKRAVVSATGRQTTGRAKGVVYVFEFNGDSWPETAQLTVEDEGDLTFFGLALSLDGNRLAVGSFGVDSPGAAFVYEYEGTGWSEPTRLVGDDSLIDDRFGQAVSLNGDDLLVGAWAYARDDISTGAGYFFEYATGAWVQTQRIVPGAAGAFGVSVAIEGDQALIGAPSDGEQGPGAGAVYAYSRSEAGWTQRAKLLPAKSGFLTRFGADVSLDSDRAVVGSLGPDGSATGYLFTLQSQEWVEVTTLAADRVDSSGIRVALDGPLALVGTPRKDSDETRLLPETGGVCSFREGPTGWDDPMEIEQPRLPGADLAFFGWSTVVDGDRAFATAPGEDSNGESAGAVYIYEQSGDTWTPVQKLLGESPGDRFGTSLAVYGDRLMVGSPWESTVDAEAGAVYVFEFDDTEWVQTAKLTPEVPGEGQHFGARLALREHRAIVASNERVGEFDSFGHVHVYELKGGSWSATAELESPRLQLNDNFGNALALGDGFALVAAPARNSDPDAPFADNVGAVEVFNFQAPNWVSVDEWVPGDRTSSTLFGWSLATEGEWAIVGEPLSPQASGLVHVYRRSDVWTEFQTLRGPPNDEALRFGQFGLGVGISGPRLLISALSINDGTFLGLAYSYEFRGVSWAFADRFAAPDPSRVHEYFGVGPSSISLDGNQAFIGAYADPTMGYEAGAAYVLALDDPLGDEIFRGDFE